MLLAATYAFLREGKDREQLDELDEALEVREPEPDYRETAEETPQAQRIALAQQFGEIT
jgi:hypothetical protein